ncbi:MAG: 3-isopropylmalate dehydratase small subunit [Anaerolineae bacterium]|nr:3-isopropylmalate dehydratase small subunit [Anaerolineae bacterium]
MQKFTTLSSTMLPLPNENIDTDQIIPARFLKVTDKAGLGDNLFADWRYAEDGTPRPDFVLNQPAYAGAKILLAGDNFGCGSSREHAPWALQGYGFEAIVSTRFADIFRNNALKNGLLPVEVDKATLQQLFSLVQEETDTAVTIDLAEQKLVLPDGRAVEFPIDGFAKACLLQGVDQFGFLLQQMTAVEDYEATHPDRVNTLQPAR